MRAAFLMLLLLLAALSIACASSAKKGEDTSSAKKGEDSSSAKKGEDASNAKKGEDTSSAKKGEDTSSAKKGEDNWTFEGCYTLDESNSVLWHNVMQGDYMTQGFCHDRCRSQSAYKYFGLQAGDKCYCGVTVQAAAKVANSRCTRPCKGNARESCGGETALQVFRIPGAHQHQQQENKQQAGTAGTPSDKGIRCSYDKSGGGNNLVCVANLKLDDLIKN